MPPEEKKGSEMPVLGNVLVTTAMLQNTCHAICAMMPMPTSVQKRFSAWKASQNPCTRKTTNSTMTSTAPAKPSSSQTTLKMKSLVLSGSQSCFSMLLPSPRPVTPPEPMAYRLCRVWSVILVRSCVQPSRRLCK